MVRIAEALQQQQAVPFARPQAVVRSPPSARKSFSQRTSTFLHLGTVEESLPKTCVEAKRNVQQLDAFRIGFDATRQPPPKAVCGYFGRHETARYRPCPPTKRWR